MYPSGHCPLRFVGWRLGLPGGYRPPRPTVSHSIKGSSERRCPEWPRGHNLTRHPTRSYCGTGALGSDPKGLLVHTTAAVVLLCMPQVMYSRPDPTVSPEQYRSKMGCLSYFGSMELVQKQPFMPFGGPLEVFSTDVTVLWGRGS